MQLTNRINDRLRCFPSWPLYVLGALPVVWLFWQGVVGGLGVDPVKAIEHQLGLWGLWLLIAGLAMSPTCQMLNLRLIKFRRAVGVLAFFYIFAHMLVWLVLDVQIPSLIWQDIVKRPYITIGMVAFILMIPLAVTSNNWSVRRLGPVRWRQLHKLTYVVALLGAIHYVMLVKGWQMQPIYYLAAIVVLLALRTKPFQRRAQRIKRPV